MWWDKRQPIQGNHNSWLPVLIFFNIAVCELLDAFRIKNAIISCFEDRDMKNIEKIVFKDLYGAFLSQLWKKYWLGKTISGEFYLFLFI